MTFPQFLIFSGTVAGWLFFVFRNVSCKHPAEKRSLPMGALGLDKMVGVQKCFACGAERFYRHGITGDEVGEWFYREHKRSAQ